MPNQSHDPNAARRLRILALWNSGPEWTLGTIAAQLGLNRNQVAGALNRCRVHGMFVEPRGNPIGKPSNGGPKPKLGGGPRKRPFRRFLLSSTREVPVETPIGMTLEDVQHVDGCRWPMSLALKDPTFTHRFCGLPRARSNMSFGADPNPYCCLHQSHHSQRATGSIKAAEKYPGWAA